MIKGILIWLIDGWANGLKNMINDKFDGEPPEVEKGDDDEDDQNGEEND